MSARIIVRQMISLLVGYEDFCDFDTRELYLAKALRTLRPIRYTRRKPAWKECQATVLRVNTTSPKPTLSRKWREIRPDRGSSAGQRRPTARMPPSFLWFRTNIKPTTA